LGALFHDLGMLKLDAAALARWNAARDESDPAWRAHVALGFDMLRGQLEPSAAAIALHHHQSFAGGSFPERVSFTGPPRPLVGKEIHVLTRIVSAAELFCRTMYPAHAPGSQEALAPSLPTVRALCAMLNPDVRKRIDPVIFRALFSVVAPYPIGSVVTLSDDRPACVVEWTPADPCRPTVEILREIDPTSRRKAPPAERINLMEDRSIDIVAIDGIDVRADNFAPTVDCEFDLIGFYRSSANRLEELETQAAPSPAHDLDGDLPPLAA
jgi:hypothetical protein